MVVLMDKEGNILDCCEKKYAKKYCARYGSRVYKIIDVPVYGGKKG